MREICEASKIREPQCSTISYPLRSVKGIIHIFPYRLYPRYEFFQESHQHTSIRLLFISMEVILLCTQAVGLLPILIELYMVSIIREKVPMHLVSHDISLDLFSQTLDMSFPPPGLYSRITPDGQPDPCWRSCSGRHSNILCCGVPVLS